MDNNEFRRAIEAIKLNHSTEFADIRGYESKSLNFQVKKGEIEQTITQRLKGAGIRVLAKTGAWGFVSTTDLSYKNLVKSLKKAYKLAYLTGERAKEKVITNTTAVFEAKNIFKPDISPDDLSIEDKYALACKGEKTLRSYDPQIVNSIASWEESTQREIIVNSNGTNVTTDYGIFRLRFLATSRRADIIQNTSHGIASNSGLKKLIDWNIEQEAGKLAQRTVKLLDAVPAPQGRHNVLMEPSLVGVYIHEAFGHASEGDAIISKDSILRDKIGHTIGIEEINVSDDPTIEGLRGSFKFDSEGTPAVRRNIVINGKLVGYLNSLETSSRLNQAFSSLPVIDSLNDSPFAANGAGRSQDFRHTVIPRMSNTYIGNGSHSFDELLEEIKNGVYLQYSYGGYVNPVKGEFLFSSQGGFLIENGELSKPIRNSAMSGLTLEVLKNTIAVGNDLDFAFPGVCGKPSGTGYQTVAVTGGGPHLAVKNIIIGGK